MPAKKPDIKKQVQQALKDLDAMRNSLNEILLAVESMEKKEKKPSAASLRGIANQYFDPSVHYFGPIGKPPKTVHYLRILEELIQPDVAAANRKQIWLKGWAENTTDPELPFARILAGESKSGFNYSIIAGEDDSHKDVHLHVIEDVDHRKMQIISPASIPEKLKKDLETTGISYVEKSDPDCAKKINQFVAEGGRRGGSTDYLDELVIAFGTVGYISDEFLVGNQGKTFIKAGTNFGSLIAREKEPPQIYNRMVLAYSA